jgi:type II secretory pathway pseudopilin PulG
MTRQVSGIRCQVSEMVTARTGHCPLSASDRRGISLLEVLAAIGVLSIGLLGLAALLPIGRYTISEATKADRAGNCGRAALRDIIIRRMLDYHNWYDLAQKKYVRDPTYNGNKPWYDQNGSPTQYLPASFVIDPRGLTSNYSTGMNPKFGNPATSVPRISLDYIGTSTALADSVFMATDDLNVPMPEDLNLKPRLPIGRPQNLDSTGKAFPLDFAGAYSWFLTVVPTPNNPTRFTVSVVVCFQRNLALTGERAVPVSTFFDQTAIPGNPAPVALAGGSLQLQREINDIASDVTSNTVAGIAIKENDWVALCNTSGLCRWYRVAQTGDDTKYLTLIGPDWTVAANNWLVALGQSVLGVYTTTIDLDTDPTWKN